jgi:uncharacterized protein YceK
MALSHRRSPTTHTDETALQVHLCGEVSDEYSADRAPRALHTPVLRVLLVVTAVSLILSGCSSPRSTEAFCATYWEQKAAYVSKYDQASDQLEATSDPLIGLLGNAAMLAQSIGDTVVIFDKLDRVAPDEIEPDVAAVRDSLKAQIESAGEMATDPLGALAGGLVQGLSTGGSWQRVGDYVTTHCGEKAANS